MRGRGYEIWRAGWQASNISKGGVLKLFFKREPKEPFCAKRIFRSPQESVFSKISIFLSVLFPKSAPKPIFMGGALFFVGEVM